ncbi:MAG: cache domain-containing protein, partial [Armatimonadetes bacterium]|nr:cache domain-containing protein [Armatimonadota bacterium]
MDLPIRTKLALAFVVVALISGVLTVTAGSFLMSKMVIGEAQRRVALGLKTARATLEARLGEEQKACAILAGWLASSWPLDRTRDIEAMLEDFRGQCGADILHVVDARGTVIATARGHAKGRSVLDSPVVKAALEQERAASGITTIAISHLAAENASLAERAYLRVVETPRAKPGGPREVREALMLEAAQPIMKAGGRVVGAVRMGVMLNRNYDLVDFVRSNVFTEATYKGKNLGTVTIFLGDVRVSTNVIGPDGERAIGTRVSAEVYDRVLGQGERWIGPAFVVGNWYVSAYEPLRDPGGRIIGILYVGVLKDRYDDWRRQAMAIFLGISLLALLLAAWVSTVLANRIARPIILLTNG